MDKEEYQVRLESIRKLAHEGEFKAAAQIADTVDWKRVKSVRTLCMIAEIYETDGRYEDTNRILQYAYWRTHVSKTVLYRLTEVNIRTGNLKEAQKYCDEFEVLSPKDSTKYILQYKLMTARQDPVSERIRVLEKYRENEFTEKWAYELASLYHEAGRDEDCAKLCDEMIVFFANGKYVTKAAELRKEVPYGTVAETATVRKVSAATKAAAPDAASIAETSAEEVDAEEAEQVRREVADLAAKKSASSDAALDGDIRARLADSIRAVMAGIRTEDGKGTEKTTGAKTDELRYEKAEEIPARSVKPLEPEKIGRTVISVGPAEEEAGEDEQITIDSYMDRENAAGEEDELDALMRETSSDLANAVASGRYTTIKSSDPDTEEDLLTDEEKDIWAEEISEALSMEAAAETAEEAVEEAAEERVEEAGEAAEAMEIIADEEEMDPLKRLYAKETDESLSLTQNITLPEEVVRELAKKHATEESEAAEARRRRAVEQTLRSAGVILPEDEEEDAAEEIAEGLEEETELTVREEETPVSIEEEEEAAEAGSHVEERSFIDMIADEPEEYSRIPVEPRKFDDVEKAIFSYFANVPGMTEQITMALADVHNNAGDKTSRSGNIMVIGRQGSGKTRLSDAIMLSVMRDLGMKAVRSAKIIAADFNEKNPAEVVSRMRGGFLVIEGAGELSDHSVDRLLTAMEFRTDDLIVVLEDEKADLKALLLRHPEIEEKFTSTIVIPVFTNDELVTFAKCYAEEKGYRMDEMGVLALYTMIGDNQSATEPVTVGRVKEMMDAAIGRAERGARRIGRHFSKRAVDKDGRVLLREKDFDI